MRRRRSTRAACAAALLLLLLAGCTPAPPSVDATPTGSTTTTTSRPRPSFFDRGARQYAEGEAKPIHGVYRYVVHAGDTAGGIAARFGTTDDAVAAASRGGLEIFEGDVLRIAG